ncbi:MAG TPA: sigma-54 dependent transcriptional regulator [Polyangiaceae bacterium]|nr:sigma-54 dependent transcriptional regulator [Polyangiaceae bacterium]
MKDRIALIADDEPAHRRMLGAALESIGMQCRYAVDGEEAVREVAVFTPHLLVLDLRMPRLDGPGALKRIHELLPTLPVVVVTAHGDIRAAVEAMKLGARDFLEKPIDIEELRAVALDLLDRPGPAARSPAADADQDEPRSLVGISSSMRQARETIRLAARSAATVLVRGESGTGKEVVARAIHELSDRQAGPFIAMNCAAVAEGVLESELFGHERGSFTGAEARRRGRFELADGGTLFLDEVAEMQPHLQAKLLRVLQERCFERVGGVTPIRTDIRVVAATNRIPTEEIASGRMREDLYYRLAVVEIVLQPLRERREDVLPTAHHLLKRLKPDGDPRLSAQVASALTRYDWPGNVRELANVLERSLLFAGNGEIRPEHLPPSLRALCSQQDAEPITETGVRPGVPLEEVERELIQKTLMALGGNRTRTAEALGLSRRALLYKIKRFGLRDG